MQDLKRIITEKDLQNKSKTIIETYINKIDFYKGKKIKEIKDITELQNDNDNDWWEDIKKYREEKPERTRRSSGQIKQPTIKKINKKGPNDQ